ncbi:MAG: DUF1295 domain-containing protein [Candidatus Babeliales bacterium]
MTSIFLIALIKKDNSIVDISWGIGFILIALISLIMHGLYLPLQIILTLLICVWGLRLSLRIYQRNKGKGEDPRYAQWRKEWGSWTPIRSFFQIFMLQGALMLIIAYPIITINSSKMLTVTWVQILGIVVWCIGFFFEAIGDYQLDQFLKNPIHKDTICTVGLWRYTRHPNYFGESLLWWGIFLMALSTPYGWTIIISPLTITYLLLYVSGIPMTERMFIGNQAYEQYKKETNAFFPWFTIKN